MPAGTGADDGFAARAGAAQGAPNAGHSWYLDLQLLEAYYWGHKYHHTASATLFYALREALAMVVEEGRENRWDRHHHNHLAFVAGVEAMGLRMHVAEGHRLWTLNTPCVPEGVDDAKLRQYLLDERGIEIAGGFGPLAGKVLRIGLMGYGSTAENVLMVLEALETGSRRKVSSRKGMRWRLPPSESGRAFSPPTARPAASTDGGRRALSLPRLV